MNIRRLDIRDFGGVPTLGPWKRKYKGEGVNMRFVGYYREVRKEHKLLFGPFRDSLYIGNRLISQKIRNGLLPTMTRPYLEWLKTIQPEVYDMIMEDRKTNGAVIKKLYSKEGNE